VSNVVSQDVKYFSALIRATIDLEPKIRTDEENLIILPKKKTIVSVCTTNVRWYPCLFISGNHCFSNVLFSTSFL